MTIKELFDAACAGNINVLKKHYGYNGKKNMRYYVFGEERSLLMGAYSNRRWETVDYLLSVGETLTPLERERMNEKILESKYMQLIIR